MKAYVNGMGMNQMNELKIIMDKLNLLESILNNIIFRLDSLEGAIIEETGVTQVSQ